MEEKEEEPEKEDADCLSAFEVDPPQSRRTMRDPDSLTECRFRPFWSALISAMMQSERVLLPGPGYGNNAILAAGFGNGVHARPLLHSLPRVSSQDFGFIAGIMLGALLSYVYGLLSQKNAEIRRLESKLQRQRKKTSRNHASNDQAENGRASEIKSCDPRKKCTGKLSNIRAVVTDIQVKQTHNLNGESERRNSKAPSIGTTRIPFTL